MENFEAVTDPAGPVGTTTEAAAAPTPPAAPMQPAVVPMVAQTDAKSNPVVAAVLKSFSQLYTSTNTAEQDTIIDDLYITNAVFDDNWYHVLGTDNIKILFRAAAKKNPAGQVTVQTSTIEPITNVEVQAVTPGAQKVVITSIHESVSGQEQRQCESTLTINSMGKITNHIDVWQGEPATFELAKRFAGSITTFFSKK